ncbi:Macrocin-O-methyltransferase (TylF) [Stappia sp. ES.058]|nr:Macrocin-O-methyltransferase (TylF) [Stappia sp. ES.058]
MSGSGENDLTANRTRVRGLSRADVWDHENGYNWFAPPNRMAKALAQYEIYKTIVGLPGDVLEFGVFKAASFIRFATFRRVLENDDARALIGFDAFGVFPTRALTLDGDHAFIENWERAGGDGLSVDEVAALLAGKGFSNTELVAGNVFDTLPDFLEAHPALRIALLHLDMDVLEPTAFVLEHLYERVVAGGAIVIDDYTAVAGATQAVDDFMRNRRLALEKAPYNKTPTVVRKPAGA